MGCLQSKNSELASPSAGKAEQKQEETKQAAPERKLDPKDFQLIKLENQVVVREPGTIQGQQFIVDGCKNCDIFLLDNSAAITIDDCVDCRFFIGPCESSVFIRTTSNSRFVVACQQLRTRECKGLDLLIYCSAGQPVIEDSTGLRIGCFQYNYFSLRAQFDAAKLSPWDNEWSNVHDFHAKAGVTNWEFLPETTKPSDLLKPLSEVSQNTKDVDGFVVPLTAGKRPRDKTDTCVVFVMNNPEAGYDVLARLKEPLAGRTIVLVRTRLYAGKQALSGSLSPLAKATGGVVGIEFGGQNACEVVTKALGEMTAEKKAYELFVSPDSAAAQKMAEEFFREIKV